MRYFLNPFKCVNNKILYTHTHTHTLIFEKQNFPNIKKWSYSEVLDKASFVNCHSEQVCCLRCHHGSESHGILKQAVRCTHPLWDRVSASPAAQDDRANQSGRSMVEMLGVLAIMGVLSVVGGMGLRSALDSAKANKLIQALSRRATVLAADKSFGTGFTDDASFGQDTDYTITCADVNNDFFTCSVPNVSKNVCEKIIALDWHFPKIVNPITCKATNTMAFSFEKTLDISSHECPPNYLYFNRQCVPSNTILENGCPVTKPIKASGKCYSCTTLTRIDGADSCTEVCSNRFVMSSFASGACAMKTTKQYPLQMGLGGVYACDTSNTNIQPYTFDYDTGIGLFDPEACYQCPERFQSGGGYQASAPFCLLCSDSAIRYTTTAERCEKNCIQTPRKWNPDICVADGSPLTPCGSYQECKAKYSRTILCLCEKI